MGDIALCDTNLGQFKSGIRYANRSMKANNPDIESVEMYGWPSSTSSMDFSSYYWAATMKLYCLFSLAATIPDSAQFFYQSALNGSQWIDSLLISRLNRVTYTDDKFLFSENSHRAMELGFWSALTLKGMTKEAIYDDEVFYFNERSKANVLLVQSQTSKAESFSRLPNEILEKERKLLLDLEESRTRYLSLVSNKFDETKQRELKGKIYDLEDELSSFKQKLKDDYPEYHALRHQVTPVNITQVQEHLRSYSQKSAAIEYLIRQGNVYYTMIAEDTVINSYSPHDINDWMHQKVERFRTSLMNREDSSFNANSRHLADLLINPVKPVLDSLEIASLIIVPDDALNYVPFELLITDTLENRYLMEDYTTSYANSLTLLLNRNQSSSRSKIISFAPSFASTSDLGEDIVRSELAQLPGALKEVESIGQGIGDKSFLMKEATESNFRAYSGDYGIIHLATHAIIDEENEKTTKLIFNLENDESNDGYLYPHEIYNLGVKCPDGYVKRMQYWIWQNKER